MRRALAIAAVVVLAGCGSAAGGVLSPDSPDSPLDVVRQLHDKNPKVVDDMCAALVDLPTIQLPAVMALMEAKFDDVSDEFTGKELANAVLAWCV